ncbi:MAG: tripartite tricarboxylate transporter TctB family protein, partial [Pseudomonadota bacterium]
PRKAVPLLLVLTFGSARMGAQVKEEESIDEDYGFLAGIVRAVALIAVLFVYYMSLERYGIVVPSIVLLPVVMLYFGERKPLTIGICSIGLPIVLYVFFRYVAGISIPLGIFG